MQWAPSVHNLTSIYFRTSKVFTLWWVLNTSNYSLCHGIRTRVQFTSSVLVLVTIVEQINFACDFNRILSFVVSTNCQNKALDTIQQNSLFRDFPNKDIKIVCVFFVPKNARILSLCAHGMLRKSQHFKKLDQLQVFWGLILEREHGNSCHVEGPSSVSWRPKIETVGGERVFQNSIKFVRCVTVVRAEKHSRCTSLYWNNCHLVKAESDKVRGCIPSIEIDWKNSRITIFWFWDQKCWISVEVKHSKGKWREKGNQDIRGLLLQAKSQIPQCVEPDTRHCIWLASSHSHKGLVWVLEQDHF